MNYDDHDTHLESYREWLRDVSSGSWLRTLHAIRELPDAQLSNDSQSDPGKPQT